MNTPAKEVSFSQNNKKANDDRPKACQSTSQVACTKCDDYKILYQESKFGKRCQAICSKLDDQGYAMDPRNQCRRPAHVTAQKVMPKGEHDDDDDDDDDADETGRVQDGLKGYFYCDEHAAVYRKFLALLSYEVDTSIQDETCLEMLHYYRRMDTDINEDPKIRSIITYYQKMPDFEKDHGVQRFSQSHKAMFALVNNDTRQWFSVRIRFLGGYYQTYRFQFMDNKTNKIILQISEDEPFPLLVHLYTHRTTYFFLYKRIGTRSDDYLGDAASEYVESTFRNRLLARALLFAPHLPPIRKTLTGSEHETIEPGESEYGNATNFWVRYPLTGRPVTLMPSMCRYDRNTREKVCTPGTLMFPVVRFSGLYYSKENDKEKEDPVRKYCGKFYFYDPESEVVLNLGKCLVAASKPHAFQQLAAVFLDGTDEKKKQMYRDIVEQCIIDEVDRQNFLSVKENFHFVFHPLPDTSTGGSIVERYGVKAAEEFYYSLLKTETDVKEIKKLGTTPLWPSTNPELSLFEIGVHDHYDQVICNLARALQYDTILLQHEIGQSRSVTEVLDVRDNSYEFLYRTPPRTVNDPWFPQAKTSLFPTIWFTSYGFISV